MRDLGDLKEYKVVNNNYNIILNANESPYDFPEALKKKVFLELEKYQFNRYPPQVIDKLYNEIERYYNVNREEIFFSNGSDEVFSKILLLCEKGENIISVEPTFEMYKVFSDMYGLNYISIPLNDDFSYNADNILKKQGKIIFISTPNNPTSTTIDKQSLTKLLKDFKGLVILDEAYAEFTTSYTYLIKEFDNLIVTRTFSKAYSLAGIRLGYALSNEKNIRLLKKVTAPYSINILSQIVALIAFKNREYIEKNIDIIKSERSRLYDFLNEFFEVTPSEANFLFFKSEKSELIYKKLLDNGILIRKFDDIKNYMRVTVGKKEENDEFIKAMREIVDELY